MDGCPGGWFYVALDEKKVWKIGLVSALNTLLQRLPDAQLMLIDMPVGLRESGSEGRDCDREARKVLGKARAASVFPVPARATLQAVTYEEAKAINYQLTGKRITRQTWNIVSKLRELDELMRNAKHARQLIRESHPEVCFWALNDGQAMQHNKKTPNGRFEREAVLYRHLTALPDLLAHALSHFRRRQLGWDDILDATVLALTALIGHASLSTLPDVPGQDLFGLPMEIVYQRA